MLSAYRNSPALRNRYLQINGITHAEIWDCDGGYQLAICKEEGSGWRECPVFNTPAQCVKWLRDGCGCLDLEILEY